MSDWHVHWVGSTACFGAHPTEAALDELARAGFEEVELVLPASRIVSSAADRANLIVDDAADERIDGAAIARWLADRNQCAAALRLTGDGCCWPTFADDLAWREVVGFVRQMGAKAVSLTVDDAARNEREVAELLKARAMEVDELRILVGNAPGACGDSKQLVEVMKRVSHPAVGIDFDPATYWRDNEYSNYEIALQRVWPWLMNLRLRDRPSGRDDFDCAPLGQGGAIDMARVWQIVRGMQFARTSTVEIAAASRRRPATLEQCSTWLTESLAHLRGIGWFDEV